MNEVVESMEKILVGRVICIKVHIKSLKSWVNENIGGIIESILELCFYPTKGLVGPLILTRS